MNWEQLIAISRLLAEPPTRGEARGRPQQARLRRAISTAYYAMFHALAENNANLFIGAANELRNSPEWARTYRTLDHGRARSQMISSAINRFPATIIDFAETFVYLQELRHDADYNPLSVFTRSETSAAISRAEAAVERFIETTNRDRRAFAAQVLFTTRR